jgi:predicted nucleic acid-binding protein
MVVDASVAARWYVNNPPFVQPARRVEADLDAGRITLLAPENLLHEVTGVIHQAVFARRLNSQQGSEQLGRFLAVEITWIETNDLVIPAWELSLRYGCSYYDALYLDIARRQGCPFIHADGRLRRALAGRFPLEIWIEDYHSA